MERMPVAGPPAASWRASLKSTCITGEVAADHAKRSPAWMSSRTGREGTASKKAPRMGLMSSSVTGR